MEPFPFDSPARGDVLQPTKAKKLQAVSRKVS